MDPNGPNGPVMPSHVGKYTSTMGCIWPLGLSQNGGSLIVTMG